jgi:hypothetical protein
MNILHINKFYYLCGGSELVYFCTANILEHHGHKSLFFSMHILKKSPCENSNCFIICSYLVNTNALVSHFKTAGKIFYSF